MKLGNRNALLVTVLLIGVAGAAFAITGQKEHPVSGTNEVRAKDANNSTLRNTKATKDDDGEENDEEEENDVPVAAKITAEEAKAAALAVQPGTVSEVDLESEDGKAIYDVEITAAGGQKFEVEVNGDTGKVIKSEVDGPDTDEEDEDTEQKEEAD